ncbi:MAG: flagellar hook-associated protein 3 [Spirochaetales bacterium]|nr:flagellar hook-associated protein 3 [Spirochaetales bacterium]
MNGARISSNMAKWNIQSSLMEKGVQKNSAQEKLNSNTRIENLRDDPVGAAMAMKYGSKSSRIEQFGKNIGNFKAINSEAESELYNILNVLHTTRELAVRGANTPTAAGAMQELALEADGLLQQILRFANHVNQDGNAIFAGNVARDQAFVAMEANVPGASSHMVVGIQYVGDNAENKLEVSDRQYMDYSFDGSKIFWAENHQVASERDARAFRLDTDSSILINGKEIQLKAGDSIYSINEKINNSGLAVEASIDSMTGGIVVSSRTPQKLWLEDVQGGSVLSDLGIVDSRRRPPYNISESSQQTDTSVFDSVMFLRDQFLQGDIEAIGSRGIDLLDKSIDAITSALTTIGTNDKISDIALQKLDKDNLLAQQNISQQIGLDFAKGITDLQNISDAYQTTLKTAGKVLQPTLLDYLR